MTLIPRPRAAGDRSIHTQPRTQAKENVERFASTADSYIAQERHSAVRRALELIKAGRPGYARFVLTRSVIRQARIAGLGDVDLPTCPCGRDCNHTNGGTP